MTQMAPIDPHPDVKPPPGAKADVWEGDPSQPRRVVFTVPRCVLNRTGDPLRSPVVVAQAVQRADGSLDRVMEPPSVSIESAGDPGLSSVQARDLAKLLVEAADQIDGWVAR